MSPILQLLRRLHGNHGTAVIVWPLQCCAVLVTSVPAAMACTALEFAQSRCPTSLAHLLSVLFTLRFPGPATSPIVCRLAHSLLYCFLTAYRLPLSTVLVIVLGNLGLDVAPAAVLV